MSRWLYRVLLYCAFPLIFLYLLKRSRRQPDYRRHWKERLGFYNPRAEFHSPLIWLHAVSVGETRAAAPLIAALKAACPQHRFLITGMTPTGRATAHELFASHEIAYLPYDYPGAAERFIKHFRPSFGVLMETELWPNLIHACADQNIPLFLANARLSEKSLRGYQKIGALIRPAVTRLAGVLAQSEMDAVRLKQLGCQQVAVAGNIKFDNLPDTAAIEIGKGWRQQFGQRKVLLMASSRDGEEALLLDTLRDWPPSLLLLLVPRHPQRFDEVAQLLASRGIQTKRRSEWNEGPLNPEVKVLLGDSMGEMIRFYAAADLAIIGGSVLPFGSQNLIEACAVGTPALLGPSTYNFSEAAKEALACHAAWQGGDTEAIVSQALYLFNHPAESQAMGEAGLAFAAAHRGATARLLSYLPLHR